MKTKLLTLALFGLLSLSFVACSEEDVTPANEIATEQSRHDCECEGGESEEDRIWLGL